MPAAPLRRYPAGETGGIYVDIQIGEKLPGYAQRVEPVLRVESWGPICVRLDDVHPADAAADGWSSRPEYVTTTPNAGARLAVRASVTGRTPQLWGGSRWVRGRVELCGDGEPSRFLPCWFLLACVGG